MGISTNDYYLSQAALAESNGDKLLKRALNASDEEKQMFWLSAAERSYDRAQLWRQGIKP